MKQLIKNHGLNLFCINGFYYLSTCLFMPYIGAYYRSIGMTTSNIGMLTAVIPLCSLLIQPIWAELSDRTGKRKQILMAMCLGVAIALLIFSQAKSFASCLVCIFLYAVFFSALLPLSDALTLREARDKDVDFSIIRLGGTLFYAVGVIIIGYLLGNNYFVMICLSSVSYMVMMISCTTLGKGMTGADGAPVRRTAASERYEGKMFDSMQIVVIIMFAFFMQIGLNFVHTFTSVYVHDLGHPNSLVGVLSCISALSEVPILLMISKIRKKFSSVQLLFMAIIFCALRLVLVSTGMVPLIMLAQCCQGVSYMVTYFICVNYISEHVRADKISEGQSILAVFQSGLSSILGNVVGGQIAQHIGIKNGFRVVAVALCVFAVFALFVNKKIKNYESNKREN